MKKLKLLWVAGLLCAAGPYLGCERTTPADEIAAPGVKPVSAEGEIIPDQYIVQFHPSAISCAKDRLGSTPITDRDEKARAMAPLVAEVEAEINAWLAKHGITDDQVLQRYTTLTAGVALRIPKRSMVLISKDPDVASLEHDRMEQLPPFVVESIDRGNNRFQTTPCGITNAGGFGTIFTGRWIWIVDTGIDLDHPDLTVLSSTPFAVNVYDGGTPDDCYGHGTHVAGTAAAINNDFGVVGVSAGSTLVPVKVFGCSGGSPTSIIVAGLDHIGLYDIPGDVVNMSLGGYYGTSGCSSGSAYLTSINNLNNSGVFVSIAAGNSASNADWFQPACVNGNNVFTVSSMNCGYGFSSWFSNFGIPPVDWIATGEDVYSTYMNGAYATLTGTSMAAPHVAGIAHWRNSAPGFGGSILYSGQFYPVAVR
jgi:subtilisin family serine protease